LTLTPRSIKYAPSTDAGIAQLVEHNLAKVGVASSNLVSRSKHCGSLIPVMTASASLMTKVRHTHQKAWKLIQAFCFYPSLPYTGTELHTK
jgi:hypothetical protein